MNPYTPLFDDIVKNHGMITAAVYGYIWRQCQKERGVCDASFQTIADELGITRRTAVTHVKLLVKYKLIEDLTPELDRKPHKYLVQEMPYTRETISPAREINALALGQEMQQTREINALKDTYTKGNKEESTAVTRTAKYFGELSGKTCNQDQYNRDWQPFIEKWINQYGEDKTKQRIREALSFAQGNNEQGKRYTIASPKSLDNILTNLNGNNGHTNGIVHPPAIKPATQQELDDFEKLLANTEAAYHAK